MRIGAHAARSNIHVRQFQRAAHCRALPAAPGDVAARLLDHLMDLNNAPHPRMPRIKNFPFFGPVGVLEPCCTTRSARMPLLATNHQHRRSSCLHYGVGTGCATATPTTK